jgi:hypothetical protein
LVWWLIVWSRQKKQYAARNGYNLVPTARLQRYVSGFDLRRAMAENAAFKISFGLTFALAALGEF